MVKPKQEKMLRAMQLSFQKRKACIMKKTMELSVLCDVAACAVVVDANGEVSTWPENRCEVLNIINRYKDWCCAHDEKKASQLSDDPLELDDSFFEKLSMEPVEDLLKDCAGDNNNDQKLLEQVDSKLHAVMKRIEFLKSAADSTQTPGLLEYPPEQSAIYMVPTPCFSETETMGSIQTSSFFEYASNQEQIIPDMVPGFFGDVAEQSFVGLLPQFVGENSEQSIFDMVPELSFIGEVPEQFDQNDFFSFDYY